MSSVPKRVYSSRRNIDVGGGLRKAGLPGNVGITTILRRSVAKRGPDGVKQSSVSREPRIVGEITIYDENDEDSSYAVYWNDPYSSPKLLKINETDTRSSANGINDYNIVVGEVTTSVPNQIAVYWDNLNSVYKPLNDGSNATVIDCIAYGINNNNNIVGAIRYEFTYNLSSPCIWYSLVGQPNLLNITIEGDTTGYNGGGARSINKNGNIVGYLNKFIENEGIKFVTPVYWHTPTSQPVKLQLNEEGNANFINDDGNIYGSSKSTNKIFKWTSYTDAPTEITTQPYINKINNRSNIIAYSNNKSPSNIYYSSPTGAPITLSLTIDGIEHEDGNANGLTN